MLSSKNATSPLRTSRSAPPRVPPRGPSSTPTGQHTPHTGVYDIESMAWQHHFDTAIPTIGNMLRETGYYTAYKGKWHLSELPETRVSNDCPDGCFETDRWGWQLD